MHSPNANDNGKKDGGPKEQSQLQEPPPPQQPPDVPYRDSTDVLAEKRGLEVDSPPLWNFNATSTKTTGATTTTGTPPPRMIDRTVIIYTSDNGFQFGQHRLTIDKRHLYEHDVRVPFVVRGPFAVSNVTLPKERIVSTIDIAPTVLEIVLEGLVVVDPAAKNNNANSNDAGGASDRVADRLRAAIDAMDGLSFWRYLKSLGSRTTEQQNELDGKVSSCPQELDRDNGNNNDNDDPFLQRNDVLISYHGEGDPRCGLADCPPPLDKIWWMPDSYNNTYHCVRTLKGSNPFKTTTLRTAKSIVKSQKHAGGDGGGDDNDNDKGENSIYCVFNDDEKFVEYYDLNQNPHQLGNDYHKLTDFEIERYERRLKELLS